MNEFAKSLSQKCNVPPLVAIKPPLKYLNLCTDGQNPNVITWYLKRSEMSSMAIHWKTCFKETNATF